MQWVCTKALLIEMVTEMRNLANQTESACGSHSKVYLLGGLKDKILPEHLPPGPVDCDTIEECLRGVKGVGDWSIKRLKSLCATGTCDYLDALRRRASWC